METVKADQVVEYSLDGGNQALSKLFNAEIYAIKAPMRQPVDEAFRIEIEEVKKLSGRKKTPRAVVLLETTGGFIEVVERISSALRRHYDEVEFVVPNFAYSAGTVLVMSGDEIYMDYFSVLGPIDPQYPSDDGSYLPGMGYLAKFNELSEAINKDVTGQNTRAELAFLLRKFDPAKLFDIEQAVEHSKALLEDWLPKYKFKNWIERENTKTPVTDKDRKDRAIEIARVLGDASHWHSHGRGITMHDLMDEKIKLKVKDFAEDKKLNNSIRHYHGLFVDYMQKRSIKAAIHSQRGMRRVG